MTKRERATYYLRQTASLMWVARKLCMEGDVARGKDYASPVACAWWALGAADERMRARRALERELCT